VDCSLPSCHASDGCVSVSVSVSVSAAVCVCVVLCAQALAITEHHYGHTHRAARELQAELAKARRGRAAQRRSVMTRSRERNVSQTRYNPTTGRTRPLRATTAAAK